MEAKINKELLISGIKTELNHLLGDAKDKFTKQLVISLTDDCEQNSYKIETTFNRNICLLKRSGISVVRFEKSINNYFDSENCCDLYNNSKGFGENDFTLFKNLINEGLVFIE